MATLYTIGFSGKKLKEFIGLLQKADVKRVVDIRLHNTSQLAGYAKKDDLAFILELVGIQYIHMPELAPDEALFIDYKKKRINWEQFEQRYRQILLERNIQKQCCDIIGSDTTVYLCSEDKAEGCHRRLLTEFFQEQCAGTHRVVHL